MVKQLLNAGLVDRLRLMVFPLLVGPGGREAMFDGVEEADLALVDQRVLDRRILLVEYAPTGQPIPHWAAAVGGCCACRHRPRPETTASAG